MSDPTIVKLQGEYDIARREELDQLLDRYGDMEPLALDLRDVRSIDSAAIRALVRFQRARKEAGRTPIVLLKPSPAVRVVIEKVELDHSFEIRDD
ncbi:MAG TPA: STAS domain-containing protein [Candidatus Baltobacteraceae bacterium]|nr:STAS domain-containing protein [Candidatus Baltobacteraceae bacterium]